MKKFGDTAQGGEKPMGCGMVTNRNNDMINKMNLTERNINMHCKHTETSSEQ